MAPRDTKTLSLLDWQPAQVPVPVVAAEVSRAATLGGRMARLMALVLRECGKSREDIAAAMADYLGESVSVDSLNKWVSEASTDHVINIVRYIALVHATDDLRLVQGLAEMFGHSVLPTDLVAAAEESILSAQIEALERRKKLARRKWGGPK